MTRAVDAHAHLHDPRLASDLDDVVARAVAAGIERILSCGEDVATSERTLSIAAGHPSVRVAVGLHPHRAASWSDTASERLRALARDERVVAIGEIGVDLSGRSAPPADQERAFEAQLRLARELGLPVVVHVRDAGDLARAVVDRVGDVRGMIHCFSEDAAAARGWVARGLYVSFAGPLTYPNNDQLRAAAAVVPRERVLVETDAPYLAPQGQRGRRNEPAFVLETLGALDRIHGASLGPAVAENAARLFGRRWGTS